MLSLYLRLGRERTKWFSIPKERVTLGSDAGNDLVLRDGGVLPFHGTLIRSGDHWYFTAGDAQGGMGPMQPIDEGGHLTVGSYTLVLAMTTPPELDRPPAATPARPVPHLRDPIEQKLLDAIASGDEASRLVYADWLEGRGDAVRAEFLRLQRKLSDIDPDDPAEGEQLRAGRERLRELAWQIDFDWRRLVGRPAVEGCRKVTFDFQCKMDWGSLAPTNQPGVRHCHGCGNDVFYVTTRSAANDHARRGNCVVVDFTQWRAPGDLEPEERRYRMRAGVPSMPRPPGD